MNRDSKSYDELWNKEWKVSTEVGPSFKTRSRIIKSLIKKYSNKSKSILDCGCGNGDFLKALEMEGYKVSGSDFSSESVHITKSKIKGNVFQMDLTKKIPKKKYDLIICSEVLEHIKSEDVAVSNINKLLNPNGFLIVSSPFLKKYWSRHDEFAGHFRRYEPGELENLLKKNNFKIIKSFGWGNLFSKIFFRILTTQEPKKILTNKNLLFKRIISQILYYLFYIDDLFISKKSGIRIYAVAIKK
jgi:ubiquinone/menaquinone biosynthesis C-methylase UbiE